MCAAACGADLLALAAAAELGLRRRIVLPFAIQIFRARSVVDRPGLYPWGELYDRFVAEAQAAEDLQVMDFDLEDPAVYEKTNEAILDVALSLGAAEKKEIEAVVVWDTRLRTVHDYTEHFVQQAQRRILPVRSIPIVDG